MNDQDHDSPPAPSEPEQARDGSTPPLSFAEAAKELLGDRMVQAILVAGALLGALEMGLFG